MDISWKVDIVVCVVCARVRGLGAKKNESVGSLGRKKGMDTKYS